MARTTTQDIGRKQELREERRRRARRRKRLRIGAIIIASVLTVALVAVIAWPEPATGNTSAENWDLPALDDDGRHAIADFEGRPTVAAFFASWCHVCEEEIPEFLDLSVDLANDVAFVGINSQDGGRGLGDAEKWGIAGAWPLAQDIGGRNGSGLSTGTFGARGMPMTVIYSPSGEVAHVQRGGMTAAQLRALLEELFGI